MDETFEATSTLPRKHPGVLLTSEGRGWLGLTAELRRIPAGPTKVAGDVAHRLGMHVGKAVNAECRCDGQFHRRVQSEGDVDFVPAGLEGEWEDDSDCTILRVSVDAPLFRQAAEDFDLNPDRMVLSPRFQLRDSGLQHILWALKAELEMPDPMGRLYVEGLGLALAAKLARTQGHGLLRGAQQALPSRHKRRVAEYIEAHFDSDLSLVELAGVAGLGVSQFKALFVRSFGLPVHQYVLRRRVERAKALLLSGGAPISQVALESGFSHQSHMARWLKRLHGLTPRQIIAMRR